MKWSVRVSIFLHMSLVVFRAPHRSTSRTKISNAHTAEQAFFPNLSRKASSSDFWLLRVCFVPSLSFCFCLLPRAERESFRMKPPAPAAAPLARAPNQAGLESPGEGQRRALEAAQPVGPQGRACRRLKSPARATKAAVSRAEHKP